MTVDDATLDLPVVELTARLDAGQLTSVALTDAYLARIDKRGPALNCFITVTAERARADAAKADARRAAGERGPVLGIPYGLKDLVDTAGIATTWGTRPMLARVPTKDADVAARLADAGAVLLGKLHCTELANAFGVANQEDAHNGACRNPWNLARWAGGSSGGSGAAVAAGLCGFAIGTETLGSIDCPAAFCGVLGLRPTYDLVSRTGVMAAAWTLDKVGPLVRDARDARAVLGVIATQPIATRGERRLRIGFTDLIDPKVADPAMAPLFARVPDVLRTFADVEAFTPPDVPSQPAVLTILLAEIRAAFDDFIRSGHIHAIYDRQPWAVKEREYQALDLRAEDYIKALRVRTQVQQAYQSVFDRFDVLVGPGRDAARPLVGYKDIDSDAPDGFRALILSGNLIGAPAVTLPIGFNADGLPLSLHAMASPFDEDGLLAFAEHYQSHSDFHRKRPPS